MNVISLAAWNPNLISPKPYLPPGATRDLTALRIRAVRVALNLRPIEVCRAIGVSKTQYSQWESGKNWPDSADAIRFCERYGVSMDWIYRGQAGTLPRDIGDTIIANYDRFLDRQTKGEPLEDKAA